MIYLPGDFNKFATHDFQFLDNQVFLNTKTTSAINYSVLPTVLVVYFVLARRLLIHLLPNNANTPLSRWLCIGSLSNIVRNNCFFFYLNRTMEIVYGKLVERRVFWIFDGSISTVESFDMSPIMGFVFFSDYCLKFVQRSLDLTFRHSMSLSVHMTFMKI